MWCKICEHIVNTDSFELTKTQQTYFIRPESLKCFPQNVLYIFACRTWSKQYAWSTKDLLLRFSNYKCAHRNFLKRKKMKQELLSQNWV